MVLKDASPLEDRRGHRGASVTATLLLVVAAMVLLGCSSTRLVSRHRPLEPLGKSIIVLRSGARITAATVTTSGDTVIARDYYTRHELRLPFAAVERATNRAWMRGLLPGMAKGALVGGAIGASMGLASSFNVGADGGAFSDPFSMTIILGGMGFFFGAPIGGILGVATGTTTYRFVHASPPASSIPMAWSASNPRAPRAGHR